MTKSPDSPRPSRLEGEKNSSATSWSRFSCITYNDLAPYPNHIRQPDRENTSDSFFSDCISFIFSINCLFVLLNIDDVTIVGKYKSNMLCKKNAIFIFSCILTTQYMSSTPL